MANRPASSHGAASVRTQANALLRKNLTFQGDGKCKQVCRADGDSSFPDESDCPIPSPAEWPPLLQIPDPEDRAVRTDLYQSADFPNESCRVTHSCPGIALLTRNNQSLGESLAQSMFTSSFIKAAAFQDTLAINAMGSSMKLERDAFIDFAAYDNLYSVQSTCPSNSTLNLSAPSGNQLNLWHHARLRLTMCYIRATWEETRRGKSTRYLQASNAYIQFLRGPATKILLEFLKEMPKSPTPLRIDLASLMAALLFSWIILQLFPVILGSLMYEKQQNLRIMMKMHGLGDGPYWMISYAYFLFISSVYMLCFIIFGPVLGLEFFTLNAYSIQAVFYSLSST